MNQELRRTKKNLTLCVVYGIFSGNISYFDSPKIREVSQYDSGDRLKPGKGCEILLWIFDDRK